MSGTFKATLCLAFLVCSVASQKSTTPMTTTATTTTVTTTTTPNPCVPNPCAAGRSKCIRGDDDQEYSCVCASGYHGEPLSDGSGCGKPVVSSVRGNIVIEVPGGKDVLFTAGGSESTSVKTLVGRLTELDNAISTTVVNLQQDLKMTKNTLSAEIQNVKVEIRDDIGVRLKNVETNYARADATLRNSIAALEQSTTRDINSLKNNLNQQQTTVSQISRTFDSKLAQTKSQITSERNAYLNSQKYMTEEQIKALLKKSYDLEFQLPSSLPLRCPSNKNTRVVVIWAEHAHTGNLGGIRGADNICQADANKYGYTASRGYQKWYAFLCTNTDGRRNLKTNYLGNNHENRYVYSGNWNQNYQMSNRQIRDWFRYPYGYMRSASYARSFAGYQVNEGYARNGPQWQDADGWTGCNQYGNIQNGRTCNEWRSAGYTRGYNTEVDAAQLLRVEDHYCRDYYAVPCITVRCT